MLPVPVCQALYDATIADTATDPVRKIAEKKRKSELLDFDLWNVASREARKFILNKVEDTWLVQLKDSRTFYIKVSPKVLLDHLQTACLGTHTVDVVALMKEMREMHKGAEGVNEYINILEAA